jgi:hypothetical protein
MLSVCLTSCVGFCGPLPSRIGAELVEMLIEIAYYIAEIMAIRFQIFPIDQDARKLLAIPNEMKLSQKSLFQGVGKENGPGQPAVSVTSL